MVILKFGNIFHRSLKKGIWIIEDTQSSALMSNIVQTARKKFAFGIGSNLPPGSDLAQNLFQIWNWFGSALFSVSLLVGSMFCFLCGNKIKSLHRLMLTFISIAYPIQKSFSLWLNLLRFRCTFFFLVMIQ